MTAFGINADVDGGLAAAARSLGLAGFPGTKVFYRHVPVSRPGLPAWVTEPLFCVKTHVPLTPGDERALRTFCSTLRRGDRLTNWQEGEHSGYRPLQIRRLHVLTAGIVAEYAPHVSYGQCLMTWSASGLSGHGPLADWVAERTDRRPLDWYGFDTYPWSPLSGAVGVLSESLRQLSSVAHNPVVAVTECNYTSSLASGVTYAGKPWQFIVDAARWATEHHAAMFLMYYRNDHGVPWPPGAEIMDHVAATATSFERDDSQ